MSRIDEIRERWAAATPGPWSTRRDGYTLRGLGNRCRTLVRVGTEYNAGNVIAQVELGGPGAVYNTWGAVDGNAEAIARAPDDIAYLLGLLEAVRPHLPAAILCLERNVIETQNAVTKYRNEYKHDAALVATRLLERRDAACSALQRLQEAL